VTLKQAESHEVDVSELKEWLRTMGRSPREQALKTRLRDALGMER
jgi:hypothetical protein